MLQETGEVASASKEVGKLDAHYAILISPGGVSAWHVAGETINVIVCDVENTCPSHPIYPS